MALISFKYSSSDSFHSSSSIPKSFDKALYKSSPDEKLYDSISSSSDKNLESSPKVLWKAWILLIILSFKERCSFDLLVGKKLYT